MKNERTLAFSKSKQLTIEDVENVSAAGLTTSITGNGSYSQGHFDPIIDVTVDI